MKKQFVVLGAGISGLALAWYLTQKWGNNASVTIIEKDHRVGGWIKTVNEEGYLFEQGPRSCRVRGEETTTLELIEQLGLKDEVIAGSPKAKIKYLWFDGKLQKMPSTLLGSLFHPLTRKALFPCIREFFRPNGSRTDESVYDFISRRFNSSIAEQFVDPLVSGIYAGDMRQLSIKSSFPHLYYWEKNHGSVLRGILAKKKGSTKPRSAFITKMLKEPLFSFKKGMETLPLALFEKLKHNIMLSTEVSSFHFNDNGVTLTLSNGQQLHADHCFSTLPAHAVAPLLAPHSSSLEQDLSKLQRSSVALVSLGYQQPVLKYKGFGYLVPAKENENVLGVVWDSAIFPEQQSDPHLTRITVMLGGSRMPQIMEMDEGGQALIALNAVSKHLSINNLPHTLRVTHATDAIPQYPVGHQALVQSIESGVSSLSPHLTLAGTSFYGVAINDCIQTAKRLALKDMIEK